MIKLDIGSGKKSSDSTFLGVDAFTEADINALMWDLPFKDGEVDVIYCDNALEHVSKFDVVPTLREWKRVLKIGGHLEIIAPDLEWACAWWLKHQQTDWSMDILFGNQKHEGEFHRTGFTVNIMQQYLAVCGGFELTKIGYGGSTVADIMNDTFPPLNDSTKENPEGWIKVQQRCFDFEILRVDDGPVSQQVEELGSNPAQ